MDRRESIMKELEEWNQMPYEKLIQICLEHPQRVVQMLGEEVEYSYAEAWVFGRLLAARAKTKTKASSYWAGIIDWIEAGRWEHESGWIFSDGSYGRSETSDGGIATKPNTHVEMAVDKYAEDAEKYCSVIEAGILELGWSEGNEYVHERNIVDAVSKSLMGIWD